MKKFLCVICLAAHLPIYMLPQDGTIDLTFGTGGRAFISVPAVVPDASKIIVQPDGKIIQVGYHRIGLCASANYTDANGIVVVRYNENGTADNTFGDNGKVFTSITGCQDEAFSVALQTDGKIVVVGIWDNGHGNGFGVIRYNSNGTLDNSFAGDGIADTGPTSAYFFAAVAIQSDGKIVVAGTSTQPSDPAYWFRASWDFTVARYKNDGSLDNSFGLNGIITTDIGQSIERPTSDIVTSLSLTSDGKIVVAGSSQGNNSYDMNMAFVRYNDNGSLDNGFGSDGIVTLGNIFGDEDVIGYASDVASALCVQPDGKIVVAGVSSSQATGSAYLLLRFNNDGIPDNEFNGKDKIPGIFDVSNVPNAIALQPDGKILVSPGFAVIRYHSDGSYDNSFGDDGKVLINVRPFAFNLGYSGIAIQGSKIIVGGYSDDFSDNSGYDFALVRLNNPSVAQTNHAPTLSSIGNKTINELSVLTFTSSATDEDVPAQILTFSLEGVIPSGASINASTGAFSWTPTELQGPGGFTFKVRVTDNGIPALYDEEEISITVNEVIEITPSVNKTVYYGYPPLQCTTLSGSVAGLTSPFSYSWSTGATSTSTTVCPILNATYRLTITGAYEKRQTDFIVSVVDVDCGKNKVSVCHLPNTNKPKQLCVAQSEIPIHLAHGDILGTCPSITFNLSSGGQTNSAIRNNSDHSLELDAAIDLSLKVVPNPSGNYFTLKIESNNTEQKINLRVFDLQGKPIEAMSNLPANQTLQIGSNYLSGVYIAEISQGNRRKLIKLVKL